LYSTCIFCHSALGHNEAIEHFPVGRRLAFDGEKGRLWAVCRKCGRWNLTPLEERWEAIEECERQYRETVRRSSTDQIGLGRVREGTDLIRIGAPLRPEFAAWRYGRHFKRRRQMTYIGMGVGVAASVAAGWFSGGVFIGIVPGVSAITAQIVNRHNELGRAQQFIVDRAKEGFGRRIWKHEKVDLRIIPSETAQGWALRFALDGKFLDFQGQEAVHIAHIIAPAMNAGGAGPDAINTAVREIEIAGSPEQYFTRVLKYGQTKGWRYTDLRAYPQEMRLAFEMASHEETERAAMEGELEQLERDWREAEEIAAIADNMFVPRAITDYIERLKGSARS
jgi:hypothetical protein